MRPRLEAALATWPRWAPALQTAPQVLRRLDGGITNETWLLQAGGERLVLRLNSDYGGPLAIDRHREFRIHTAAAQAGLAPGIRYFGSASELLVTDWVDGRHLTEADFADPGIAERLHRMVAQLQALPLDLPCFDYWGHLCHYRDVIASRGGTVPPMLERATARHEEGIRRFQAGNWQPLPVHHDINPGNVIDTAGGLRLIDWEYAARGCGDLDLLRWKSVDALCDPVLPVLRELMDDYWLAVSELLD